jgi:Ca2+-binding RTX toxin-like protein
VSDITGTEANDELVGTAEADTIVGLAGDDSLSGGDGNDLLQGGSGDDTLEGGAGNDTFYGDDGEDTLSYANAGSGVVVIKPQNGSDDILLLGTAQDGDGGTDYFFHGTADRLIGSAFNDSLTGAPVYVASWGEEFGHDWIEGGAGNDTIDGLGGDDELRGDAGDDLLIGGGSSEEGNGLEGGAGNDTLVGTGGTSYALYERASAGVVVDLQNGTASDGDGGTDTLTEIAGAAGSAHDDTLLGSTGDDEFMGYAGNDSIDGGDGTDTVYYDDDAGTAGVVVDLVAGTAVGADSGSDTLVGIENVLGTFFNDSLVGSDAANILAGDAGSDTLSGGAGADEIHGENGADLLYGGADDDLVDGGTGSDTLYGDGGNDTLVGGGHGAREYDFVIYAGAGASINVDLAAGTADAADLGNDVLVGIDGVIGSNFADTIVGSVADDYVRGRGGSDFLNGGAGFDIADYRDSGSTVASLFSGEATYDAHAGTGLSAGTDTLDGFEGLVGSHFDDTLIGSAGNNYFRGQNGNDLIDGGAGIDDAVYNQATGSVEVDLALGSASGANGNDTLVGIENLRGSNFDDTLRGDGSNNVFEGNGGNDLIEGRDGEDLFNGGAGNDTLDGGSQPANLPDGAGNPGRQYFDIADYSGATDRVAVDLGAGTAAGDASVGNDLLTAIEGVRGSAYDDTLIGSAGDNIFRGNGGNDSIDGGDGYDVLDYTGATVGVNASLATGLASGGAGSDTFSGMEVLIGGNGNDTLVGDAENNALRGNAGNDSLDGGAGIDRIDYRTATGAVVVNLGNGTSAGADGSDTLANFENARGSDLYNDTLIGSAGANVLEGRGGSDVLIGGAGNDTLDGGEITDLINYNDLNIADYSGAAGAVNVNLEAGTASDGQGGSDTLLNINFVTGSAGNDTLTGSTDLLFEQFTGGAGNDVIDGGAVTDTLHQLNVNRVNYSNTNQSVVVDLSGGTATGSTIGSDTLINIQQVNGSSANDTLAGSDSALTEQFRGYAGNDRINGRGGVDIVRYDINGIGAVNVNLATGVASDGQGGTDTLIAIEGVRGSGGNDTLTGGLAANDALEIFMGNAGADTINGGSGYDRTDYTSSTAGVTVTLGGAGAGSAQDGYGTTDTLVSIEAVRGSTFGDRLNGSAVATLESFEGREGNDTIDGGGGLDRVVYELSKGAVTVNLATGTATDGYGGTDTLSAIEDVLGSRNYADALTGSTAANRLDGLGGNDNVNGGAGNDTLIGGTGNDTLVGGTGNDTYVVDVATDVISETTTTLTEIDTVQSGVTWTLGANLENLTLTGSSAINGTGNTAANLITGNAAANSLNGRAGNDTLVGGTGNDIYVVDVATDVINETSTTLTEIDTVQSAATWVLGANLENLTLTGSSAINGTGNTAANLITGNAAANSLNGRAGNDTLVGGTGNDIYVVDVATDLISETSTLATEIDTVQSTATWTLGANLENLTLTGSSAINGTGNTLANLIAGNTGANALVGGSGLDTLNGGAGNDTLNGGAGNDSLIGGTGLDTFYFNTAPSASSNADRVGDFNAVDDRFLLENAVFTKLTTTGAIAATNFRANTTGTAVDANDYILYDTNGGQLYYDADGSGVGARVLFATLTAGTPLTAADFWIS